MPLGDMSHLASRSEIDLDLEQLRARLARISEAELMQFGGASKYLCSRQKQLFGGK